MSPLFTRAKASQSPSPSGDFGHMPVHACYLDGACQTPRPASVLRAMQEYHTEYNACGGRAKYGWGVRVDENVAQSREALLTLTGKSPKEYAVAFTLNTTYGINLVLHQLPDAWKRIVTSEIEHNSVFVPSQTWAARRGAERLVLPREENGALAYDPAQLDRAVVLVNAVSNIDGRRLENAARLADDVHARGGLLLLDGAQALGHNPAWLRGVDFDAIFTSGHKMYGPSIGAIVIRRELLRTLTPFFLGGGTVADVERETFTLLEEPEEHAVLEPGLQDWAGIIGLGEAVRWMGTVRPEGRGTAEHEEELSRIVFDGLRALPRVHLVNAAPSPVISFHVDGLDSHRLAILLDGQGILCRSGHFCCHYYLQHLRALPPLLRVSLGLHNTRADAERFLDVLGKILSVL